MIAWFFFFFKAENSYYTKFEPGWRWRLVTSVFDQQQRRREEDVSPLRLLLKDKEEEEGEAPLLEHLGRERERETELPSGILFDSRLHIFPITKKKLHSGKHF